MVYITYNYRVLGLRQSSGIVETRKHNVSESGFVSVLRLGAEVTYAEVCCGTESTCGVDPQQVSHLT
jgi:hypothetical protein